MKTKRIKFKTVDKRFFLIQPVISAKKQKSAINCEHNNYSISLYVVSIEMLIYTRS